MTRVCRKNCWKMSYGTPEYSNRKLVVKTRNTKKYTAGIWCTHSGMVSRISWKEVCNSLHSIWYALDMTEKYSSTLHMETSLYAAHHGRTSTTFPSTLSTTKHQNQTWTIRLSCSRNYKKTTSLRQVMWNRWFFSWKGYILIWCRWYISNELYLEKFPPPIGGEFLELKLTLLLSLSSHYLDETIHA